MTAPTPAGLPAAAVPVNPQRTAGHPSAPAKENHNMGARAFMDFLRDQRNGATHDELTEALHELNEAVVAEGKVGKMTFTLAIQPHGDGSVMVVDEVKITKPKPRKGGSIFFVTPEGNLQRNDPKQPDLPLREIGPALAAKALA